MKKILIIPIFLLSLFSCNNNDDSGPLELVGTWRLIEQYSDPGDGSGDYVAVNSDKTITFTSSGTITSNGNLCSMDTNSDGETTGTFDASENGIFPDDCSPSVYRLGYEIKGNRLFVYYPCIEGCGQKFRKSN